MSKINEFISYSIDNGLMKEQVTPPWPGAKFDETKHRWVSGYEKNDEKNPPVSGKWNTTKLCSKCGWKKNLAGGSDEDKTHKFCPSCGGQLESKPFSPNF